jgi:hypothetical protein
VREHDEVGRRRVGEPSPWPCCSRIDAFSTARSPKRDLSSPSTLASASGDVRRLTAIGAFIASASF